MKSSRNLGIKPFMKTVRFVGGARSIVQMIRLFKSRQVLLRCFPALEIIIKHVLNKKSPVVIERLKENDDSGRDRVGFSLATWAISGADDLYAHLFTVYGNLGPGAW